VRPYPDRRSNLRSGWVADNIPGGENRADFIHKILERPLSLTQIRCVPVTAETVSVEPTAVERHGDYLGSE